MRRLALFLLFIPFLLGKTNAQTTENSLLWEVSGNGLKAPSYIYGTIHIMDQRVFDYDSTVIKKILACDALSGELLFDETMDLQAALNDVFMKGKKLKDLYKNKNDYKLVQEYLVEKLGIFVMATDSMKPIYTMSMLSTMETQMDQSVPLDMHLQDFAKSHGKKILGIETMEEQQAALNAIPLTDQAQLLLEVAKAEDTLDEDALTEKMVQSYLKQDLTALDSLLKMGSTVDTFEKNLLTNRNVIMADRIEAFIKQQPTFNTLGAGHLKGKNGVITLLVKKGYTIKPVVFKFNN